MNEVPAVLVSGLVKRYTRHGPAVLDGVDLRIEAGELVAVTGPSGSGKSTLLHLLAALDRPTSGTIVVGGNDLAGAYNLAHHRREHVGLVFQLHNLLPHLTTVQNVMVAMYGRRWRPASRRRRAEELLHAVGLDHLRDRKPPELSGGERQRVAVARALANDPPVVLADEPTGSLDEDNARLVIDRLRAITSEGHTVLVVTHDPKVVAAADRSIRLVAGRIEPELTDRGR